MSKQTFLCLSLLYSTFLSSMQLVHNGKKVDIASHNIDPELRGLTQEQFKFLLDNGHFSLKEIGPDEYVLRANVKGLGGNPYFATIVGFAAGVFCKREADLFGAWLKKEREVGCLRLKSKSECDKTIKDRLYEIYDKVLYDGLLASFSSYVRTKYYANELSYSESEKFVATLNNNKQLIRDTVVMQLFEKYNKQVEEFKAAAAAPAHLAGLTHEQLMRTPGTCEYKRVLDHFLSQGRTEADMKAWLS